VRVRLMRWDEAVRTFTRVLFRETHKREFKAEFIQEVGNGYIVEGAICRVAGQAGRGGFSGEIERCGCVETWESGRMADIRQAAKEG
jgi:hypothetical protein